MLLQYFFLPKNSYFWLRNWTGTNKRQKYFRNYYLGDVTTQKWKIPAFYGAENRRIWVASLERKRDGVNFATPSPYPHLIISRVWPVLTTTCHCWSERVWAFKMFNKHNHCVRSFNWHVTCFVKWPFFFWLSAARCANNSLIKLNNTIFILHII
jgi:hypothetical protein